MKAKTAKIKDTKHSKSMFGKEPFKIQAKKPESDDAPGKPRPPSTNKNASKAKSARSKRLTGLML